MSSVLRIAPWPGADQPADPAADERLVAGLRGREPWAAAALWRRYATHVDRVLVRVLGGGDAEREELLHDVFTRAWEAGPRLADAGAVKGWLTQIAVFTARGAIRRRRRRRWLSFLDEVPDVQAPWAGPEVREAAASVYRILDRMPADERIPFALRAIGGMELTELAEACGMSVATVRRRLASAERRFAKLARGYDSLAPWRDDR